MEPIVWLDIGGMVVVRGGGGVQGRVKSENNDWGE